MQITGKYNKISEDLLSMSNSIPRLILVFFLFIHINNSYAAYLVYESFNNQSYNPPLTFYNNSGYDSNIKFVQGGAYNRSGFCLEWDHSAGSYVGIGILHDMETYVKEGLYIRYWVKYSQNYLFPEEEGYFDNLKMFKLGEPGAPNFPNGYDIEFIYKNSNNGGPSNLQLFWIDSDGNIAGTGTGNTTLGGTLTKDVWHKIEIYLKVAAQSTVHVQVDDFEVFKNTNARIKLPSSAYSETKQFMSLRTGSKPSIGHGKWYTDNITIIHNEGDLSNDEPPEPGNSTIHGDIDGN